MHPSALPLELLARQCEVIRTRRSGPGGQHRNKVETAIVLKHLPTGISAEANERRSQAQNQEQAVFRLRVRLALEVRTDRGVASQPTELWRSRCRNGVLSINPGHDDFPALLAESLDAVSAQGGDLPGAAAILGCTASQLLKLLRHEPQALLNLNREREKQGLHKLK